MFALYKTVYMLIALLLSGWLAVKLTLPLLASWFGVTITITGSGPIAGMYLYLLSSLIVSMGLFIVGGLLWLVVGFIIKTSLNK